MPFITDANARELSRLGHEARRQQRANAESMPDNAKLDGYLSKRLMRVRKQVDKLDGMIEEETDPQKLDRLASALARLSEIERQLANRPLPGSFKPTAIRAPKATQVEPLD